MKAVALICLLLAGCASYPYRLGDCKDDAAMACLLEPRCQVAWWRGNPGHVQAFVGEAWLHSGHDNYTHYVFEGGRDMDAEPDRIFGEDEYLRWYKGKRK